MSESEIPLTTLRALCLALPQAREVEAWGAPTFRVKTIFATYAHDGTPSKPEVPSAWVKSRPTNQQFLLDAAPDRFFIPPYVGAKGWIGVRLTPGLVDWDEVKDLLWEAWRESVPKKLLAEHPVPPGNT